MPEPSSELLGLLSDDRRLSILLALLEHRGDNPQEPGLSFSGLREAADIDDPGNFNYHLDRLCGPFITDTEVGYELTHTGEKVAGLLVSGAYDDPEAETAHTIDRTCPHQGCEAPLAVNLSSGGTEVRCTEEHFCFETGLLPGADPGRDATDLLDLAVLQWQEYLEFIGRGEACPNCFGRMPGDMDIREVEGHTIAVATFTCERCGRTVRTPPGAVAIRHPAVVALYHRAGEDVRTVPPWEMRLLDFTAGTIQDGEAPVVVARAQAGEEALDVTIGPEMDVRKVEPTTPDPSTTPTAEAESE
jgi:hypothetical protein